MTIANSDEGVRALVKELDSAGDLPAGFGPLFHSVPRDRFLPDRIWVQDAEGGYRPVDRLTQPERWLAAAYTNESVVTQFDDGRTQWPDAGDRPTCSASMPSVVAAMLDTLAVRTGHSVLEIGAGTGFNAALLTELVGRDGFVATVDVDGELVRGAGRRLAAAGYHEVRAIHGDGMAGMPDLAPFDRVIATASAQLGRVPYAWVEQTRPGGVIVTPVRADLTSGPLVRFTVNHDGTATGRTMPIGVGFMEMRSQRSPRTSDTDTSWESDDADRGVTSTKPWPMLDNPTSRWAVAIAVPSCRYNIEASTEERPYKLAWLRDPLSGSWASVVPVEPNSGQYVVRQTGPRRLWDEAEAAYAWWKAQGHPSWDAWEWTITPYRQSISLGSVAP